MTLRCGPGYVLLETRGRKALTMAIVMIMTLLYLAPDVAHTITPPTGATCPRLTGPADRYYYAGDNRILNYIIAWHACQDSHSEGILPLPVDSSVAKCLAPVLALPRGSTSRVSFWTRNCVRLHQPLCRLQTVEYTVDSNGQLSSPPALFEENITYTNPISVRLLCSRKDHQRKHLYSETWLGRTD
eukprot:scpid98667/ scgid26866/ 